jgi:hypothetical protein
MKKIVIILFLLLVLFSFNTYAGEVLNWTQIDTTKMNWAGNFTTANSANITSYLPLVGIRLNDTAYGLIDSNTLKSGGAGEAWGNKLPLLSNNTYIQFKLTLSTSAQNPFILTDGSKTVSFTNEASQSNVCDLVNEATGRDKCARSYNTGVTYYFKYLLNQTDKKAYLETFYAGNYTFIERIFSSTTSYAYNGGAQPLNFYYQFGGSNENISEIIVWNATFGDQPILASGDTTQPVVLKINQTPADISSLDLFSRNLTIWYNMTDDVKIKGGSEELYFKVNNTQTEIWEYVNGTEIEKGYHSTLRNSTALSFYNISNLYFYNVFADIIFPSINMLDLEYIENTTHNINTMTNSQDGFKMTFYNFSTNSQENILEIYTNSSGVAGALRFYACNLTYSTGRADTNTNCYNFYNMPYTQQKNHTHGTSSVHWTVPFIINESSRRIGTVRATTTMQIVVLNGLTGTWNIWYVNKTARVDTVQSTTTRGASWTNFAGTIDAHIHQFSGNDTIYYYACANDSSDNRNCSAIQSDNMDLGNIPPLPPNIFYPTSGLYKGYQWINYTQAIPFNSYTITQYNITLRYLNGSRAYEIKANNSVNVSLRWNTQDVNDGSYDIRVWATDNNSLNAFGVSDNFTIHNEAPIFSIHNNNASSISKYNDKVKFAINISDAYQIAGYIFSTNNSGQWINRTFTPETDLLYWANETITVNQTRGNFICGKWYFNNSLNTWNESNNTCFIVSNTFPSSPINIGWTTVGGDNDSALLFNQVLNFITSTCNADTTDNDTTYCNVTLTKPSLIKAIDNQPMTNISNSFSYSLSQLLDEVGIWKINITSYDLYGGNSSSILQFTVSKLTPTIYNGYYIYDYDTLPTNSTLNSDFDNYTFDTVGIRMNWGNVTTQLPAIELLINQTKARNNQKIFLRIYFGGDYNTTKTYTNTTCGQVNSYLTDLKYYPYDESVIFILMELNASNNGYRLNFSNKISECIVNATGNQFQVYVNYTNSSLDSTFVADYNSLLKVTATSNESFINKENVYLRNYTSLTRIYYQMNETMKNLAYVYHTLIMTKLRAGVLISTFTNYSIAELKNYDIIAFNNQSSQIVYTINISNASRNGKDVWDSTSKTLIANGTTGVININMTPLSFSNIFIDNIGYLTRTAVYSDISPIIGYYGYNVTTQTQSTYAIVSAQQAKFSAYDPSFKHYNQFFIHYSWINATPVTNYTPYCQNGVVVIADYNKGEINKTINCTSNTFFYVSVASYNNSDAWSNFKKTEINNIITNYSTGIFLDGLDTAVSGVNFSTRFRDLANYIMVQKNKKCITNDYTSYSQAGVGGICNYDMKESFCGRWNGSVSTPYYYYEDLNIDLARAEYARTNGNAQLLMSFGDRFDTDKLMYCYAEYLVLFGTQNNNTFRYGQPNFQSPYENFVYDAGSQLENTWTKANDSYYSRRYSNGKIWFNPTNHTWDFERNKKINNITLAVKAQIYSGSVGDTTSIAIYINNNLSNKWTITWQEIASNSSGNCCQWDSKTVYKDVTAVYNKNGEYIVRFDSDNPSNPTGMNIYNTPTAKTGVFSHYKSTTYHPNAINDSDAVWSDYGRINDHQNTTQWVIDLIFNYTDSYQIDNGITDIIQNVTQKGKLTNLTIKSTKNYPIEVWSDTFTVTGFANLSYWNGTAFTKLTGISNTSDCDSANPTYGSTIIDGENHKACFYENKVKVAVPRLSTMEYQADIDDLYPIINVTSPTSRIYNQTNIKIEFNATDDYNVSSYWYNNGTSNITYTSISTIYLPEGLFNFTFFANDSLNQISNVSRRFEIDTTSPQISVLSTSMIGSFVRNYTFINATVTDAHLERVLVSLYNITGLVNVSNTSSSSVSINITNLKDGIYYWNITANDSVAYINYSATYSVLLDTTAPTITIDSPINENNYSSNIIFFNISATDAIIGLDTIIYGNQSQNYTNTSMNITLNEGNFTYVVWANDTLNNLRITGMNFSIDSAPNISFVSPTFSGVYPYDYILVNLTASDISLANISMTLYNSTGLVNQTITGDNNLYLNITNLPTGLYYLNATVNDTLNHITITETRTIELDSTSPSIINVSNTSITDTSVQINVTTNKRLNVTISYGTNMSWFRYNTSSNGFSNYTGFIISSLTQSTLYYYNVTVCDSINNCLTNGTYNFTTTATPVTPPSGGGGGGGGLICKNLMDSCFYNVDCCSGLVCSDAHCVLANTTFNLWEYLGNLTPTLFSNTTNISKVFKDIINKTSTDYQSSDVKKSLDLFKFWLEDTIPSLKGFIDDYFGGSYLMFSTVFILTIVAIWLGTSYTINQRKKRTKHFDNTQELKPKKIYRD